MLAYGTSSCERANTGFEIRLNAEFAACGLTRASRFVLARRIRVARSDQRIEATASGDPVLGRLPEALCLRRADLFGLDPRTPARGEGDPVTSQSLR